MKKKKPLIENCPIPGALKGRPLLTGMQTVALKRVFRILANETRLRMLHALIRSGELCVNELAQAIAMKPQAISNQLQRMADCGILESRRNGINIYYTIVDPCVPELVDRALCLIEQASNAKAKRLSIRVRY